MPPKASDLPIHIKPGNLQTSGAIDAWVRRKLAGVFRRYRTKMTAVEVHFENVNGPKHGGSDARCVMEARVNGRTPIAIRARAGDLYTAIDAAARKLESAIARAVERIDTRARRRFRTGRTEDAGTTGRPRARSSRGTPASRREEAAATEPARNQNARVIIAGYGPVGRALAEQFARHKVPFIVVDTNPATARSQKRLGISVLCGDATDPAVLRSAGGETAAAIAITIPDGEEAIRACAAARGLSSTMHIAARTTFLSQGRGALRAGADSITVEDIATAESMAREVESRLACLPAPTGHPLAVSRGIS